MAKKLKRKRRHIMAKEITDLNVPINIDIIGSENDPCFAKLFDPKEKECSRCGDSEICSIAMGQRNHILRINEEDNKSFKDLEEKHIVNEIPIAVIKKSIKNRIREMVKMDTYVKIEEVVNDIFASYSKDGFTHKKIKKLIIRIADNSDHLVIIKDRLKWQK